MNQSALAITGLVCVLAGNVSADVCKPDLLDIKSGGDVSRFSVEIADTYEERAIGLMNRPHMGQFAGMLFVYDRPQQVSFWMKNTLIPLDMLFIDESGIVTRIHENAIPHDRTGIPGGNRIQYVFEVNGGMVDLLDIEVGAQIRHPDISNGLAIWPCSE